MRLYTADEHYGHLRICELAGRPFPSGAEGITEMNEELIRRFSEVAGEDDETWHLGDFAMGKISETLTVVGQLNGSHQLVPGNHDRCWHGRHAKGSAPSSFAWAQAYEAAGFTMVWKYEGLSVVHVIRDTPVTLSHFPYKNGGDSRETDRYAEHRLADDGSWLLCGHVHQRWRQKGRMINVGVDAWGGYPVREDQVAELIATGPRDLEPLPW